jgi:hypothetical protein
MLALLVNSPRGYRAFSVKDVNRMLREWDGGVDEATFLVSEFQAAQLEQAYRLNNVKARLLQASIGVELLGVALVAAASVVTLARH